MIIQLLSPSTNYYIGHLNISSTRNRSNIMKPVLIHDIDNLLFGGHCRIIKR